VIGDAIWLAKLLENKIPMAILPEPLAVFTMTGENLGATPRSEMELVRWQGARNKKNVSRLALSVLHRLRKATAGAYRRRKVDVEVFTSQSPGTRQHRTATVGFAWPKG
jgi:hypothetical protein